MVELPPIDMAIALPAPRFPRDVEPHRMSRSALQDLAHHDDSHDYSYSWGYTIFRTAYAPGSDETFAKAIERLAVYANFFTRNEHAGPNLGEAFDPRPRDELWSRYHCEVMQDEKILSGASESEAGDMFDAWIRQHRRAATTTNASPRPSGRLLFCLMLDEDSIKNILELPENPRALIDRASWVKVVTNKMRSAEEGGRGRWWLRMGVTDYLWPLWFFPFEPDTMLEEMGWEDAEEGVQNLWGNPTDWFNEIMARRD